MVIRCILKTNQSISPLSAYPNGATAEPLSFPLWSHFSNLLSLLSPFPHLK